MNQQPTIGVVIPTLNCASLLDAHLDAIELWLDAVQEIVVVDSHSTDGTWDILCNRLSGPKTTFYQRPKGLYQAWNYGVSQLSSQLLYFSTIGDHITNQGLQHLRDVAQKTSADVVISPPAFVEEDGSPIKNPPHWPIHELIRVLDLREPALIDNWTLLLLMLENPIDAILGSSASNIYRTDKLRECPFSTDYGSVGDGAWGLSNLFDFKLAATPECFSIFRQHQKSSGAHLQNCTELGARLFALLVERLDRIIRSNRNYAAKADLLQCRELADIVQKRIKWQDQLEGARSLGVPWQLNPLAWHARQKRNHFRKAARDCRDNGLRSCRQKELEYISK
jgi:glycosyltransferase involved in cell wall biosynthesis